MISRLFVSGQNVLCLAYDKPRINSLLSKFSKDDSSFQEKSLEGIDGIDALIDCILDNDESQIKIICDKPVYNWLQNMSNHYSFKVDLCIINPYDDSWYEEHVSSLKFNKEKAEEFLSMRLLSGSTDNFFEILTSLETVQN